MKKASPLLLVALLVTICFTLATVLEPRATTWNTRASSGNVLKMMMGDGKRIFAEQMFTKADVYFHSGYYPSIFDRQEKPTESPLRGDEDHAAHQHDEHGNCIHEHGDSAAHDEEAHEKEMAYLGESHDWVERFGQNFRAAEHTHLSNGKEREMLPWLKLSAELDPGRVETYTTASYWLRTKLGKAKEAEEFLRDGLRNNPNSYEILFELGKLYYENNHDTTRARNVWELALRRWTETELKKEKPDLKALNGIADNLANLEEKEGNYERAMGLFELAKKGSPNPAALDKHIEELREKMAPRASGY